MKIYTRTGDKGETSLFGGKRVSKASLRVEAYGTVDELNSVIGVVIAQISNFKFQISNIQEELIHIQNDLLDIGSVLAIPSYSSSEAKRSRERLHSGLKGSRQARTIKNLEERVLEFEMIIDKMTDTLPQLTNFILPGGSIMGAHLQVARSIARRAERRVIGLLVKEDIDTEIIMYFNRLSDLLFTMARFVNYQEKSKEIIWNKR